MIRKSNYTRQQLVQAIGDRVQAFQDATDELDEAVARRFELNRTDLRCLSVLTRAATTTASVLADAAGLTRGAMTTVLDRLEAGDYVRRVRDDQDRRSVRVELTDKARKKIDAVYGPLAKEGFKMLQKYTAPELAAIVHYLDEGVALQRAHAERIRRAT